jgi:hypothetical protein
VFGKANNSAINLSDIANANNPTGGFVINGEVAGDRSGHAVPELLPFGSAYTAPTIKSSKPSPLTSPALETEQPLASPAASPLITKPPKGLLASAIALRLIAPLLALPKVMSMAMAWMI